MIKLVFCWIKEYRTFEQEVGGSISARTMFFPRIDVVQCDSVLSSFTSDNCFDDVHVRKQPAAWKQLILYGVLVTRSPGKNG